MDKILPRGPQCNNTPYQQEMNYPHTVTTRKSNEDLIHEDTHPPEVIHRRKPPQHHVQEEIKSDQIYVNVKSTSTEEQLGLSQEIYTLKLNIYQLSTENGELRNEIHFLKEQNSDLSFKLTNQAISDLKNYEEEKRQWKMDREDLENKLNLFNGIIRGLDEDKRHQGEKISMLEIALKTFHPSPQHTNDYAYNNPRDAMNTSYSNTVQHFDSPYFRGHSSEISAYGKPGSSPAYLPAYPHSHPHYDPALTCDFCGSNFLHGEIQKLREHLNTMHPTN